MQYMHIFVAPSCHTKVNRENYHSGHVRQENDVISSTVTEPRHRNCLNSENSSHGVVTDDLTAYSK